MVKLSYPLSDPRIFFEVRGQTLLNLTFSDKLDANIAYPHGRKVESEESWGKLMAKIGNCIGFLMKPNI